METGEREGDMKQFKFLLLVLVPVLATASSAYSEPWVDFFLGAAIPSRDDVEVKETGQTATVKDVNFNDSLLFGGRIGWWTGSLPWFGLALDVFHFSPDINRQTRTFTLLGVSTTDVFEPVDVSVTVIAFNFMGRYGLSVSQEFKNGRTQLYGGIGPGIFITTTKDKGNFDPSNQRESDTSVGLDVKAGIKFFLTKNMAIFTEGRFTHHSPELKFSDTAVRADVKTTLDVFHVGGGFSYHHCGLC
jgi:opacity protein-like surface antigen